MKIIKDEFIFHHGDIITVHNSNINDGEYQIVESNGKREILYNIREETIIETQLPLELKYEIWNVPTREKLELLYEALVKISIDTIGKSDVNAIEDNAEQWVQKANVIKMLLEEEL